jgi:FdrA protein
MGPDCGTAIIDGVPLAFANVVPRGDIAIVGASGTGIQEVSCLIARAGEGISHAIGVGSRDLTEAVDAISTLTVLDWLERDVATHHIVLISKPPARSVVDRIAEFIRRSSKSYTVCLVGSDNLELPDNAKLTTTLKDAAAAAVKNSEGFEAVPAVQRAPAAGRYVRGLYSGGTLAAEAQVVFLSHRQPVLSNAPVPGAGLFTSERTNHIMIDLGDDQFTRGRPHPMIDPAVRDEPIHAALSDPDVGAVLLDVVIGFGAHADPAGHLAGLLDRHGRSDSVVIASVTGTDEDPQVRARQVSVLERAGVMVAPSNADAAELALACLNIG